MPRVRRGELKSTSFLANFRSWEMQRECHKREKVNLPVANCCQHFGSKVGSCSCSLWKFHLHFFPILAETARMNHSCHSFIDSLSSKKKRHRVVGKGETPPEMTTQWFASQAGSLLRERHGCGAWPFDWYHIWSLDLGPSPIDLLRLALQPLKGGSRMSNAPVRHASHALFIALCSSGPLGPETAPR